MICKLCAWAADTRGDAEWIEEAPMGFPDLLASTGLMRAAAVEAHAQCAAGQGCDCQHWFGSVKLGPALVDHFPPRCSACYRRVATKGGAIAWHKINGGRCPGSGVQPLVKGTAPSVISWWRSLSASPDES